MFYVTLVSLFIAVASASPALWGNYLGQECSRVEFECDWHQDMNAAKRDQRRKIDYDHQWQMVKEDGLIWQCSKKPDTSTNCTENDIDPLQLTAVGNTNEGASILLQCPSNTYCRWRHRNSIVNTSLPRYRIMDLPNFNCSLRISDIQKSDQGFWNCNHKASWLTIQEKEAIIVPTSQPLTSVAAEEDSAIILPCRGSKFNATKARTTPISSNSYSFISKFDSICFWMHDTTAVFSHRQGDTPDFRILHYGSDYQQCDLVIRKVKKEHEGIWFCTRPKSMPLQVHLKVTESIAGPHADVTAVQGLTAFLPCRMKTTNKLCFWAHNSTIVLSNSVNPEAAGYEITSDPEKGSCDLLIHSVRSEDIGAWYCTILGNEPRKLELAVTVCRDIK